MGGSIGQPSDIDDFSFPLQVQDRGLQQNAEDLRPRFSSPSPQALEFAQYVKSRREQHRSQTLGIQPQRDLQHRHGNSCRDNSSMSAAIAETDHRSSHDTPSANQLHLQDGSTQSRLEHFKSIFSKVLVWPAAEAQGLEGLLLELGVAPSG